MSEPFAGGPPTPEERIQVYLVDDHAVARRGLQAYLEMLDDMEVVGEAADGGAAVEALRRLAGAGRAPDVVLMDLLMPGMDGITAIGLIKKHHPDVVVVALTGVVDQSTIQAALSAGAAGYVLKAADADEVAAAIRAGHRGEVHISAAAVRELAKGLRPPGPATAPEPLTDREREVLALVATGASNKDIGQALSISERTARTHVSNILSKIGLHSRTQAALWAIREGLAPPDG